MKTIMADLDIAAERVAFRELDEAEYAEYEQWMTGLAEMLQLSAYASPPHGLRIRKTTDTVEFFRKWRRAATTLPKVEAAPELTVKQKANIERAALTLNHDGHHKLADSLRGVLARLQARQDGEGV